MSTALPTGYDERKQNFPLWDFMFGYFPDAWLAVVQVSVEGNKQHNPGERLHWARGKSMDQLNTAMRHQFDYGMGTKRDTDGCYHLGKAIWRLMAQLQLDIEAERGVTISKESESCGCGPVHAVSCGSIPFRHWTKDPLVPYVGCHCGTCEDSRSTRGPS